MAPNQRLLFFACDDCQWHRRAMIWALLTNAKFFHALALQSYPQLSLDHHHEVDIR